MHGIYDTKATMLTFESRSEFQSYLQEQAGVSGSFFGFYGGVKGAWGSSTSAASQQYMALLSVDINRFFLPYNDLQSMEYYKLIECNTVMSASRPLGVWNFSLVRVPFGTQI